MKGSHVQMVVEIQNREYAGNDGMKKSVTEIRVQRLVRLDRAAKTTEPLKRLPRKRSL